MTMLNKHEAFVLLYFRIIFVSSSTELVKLNVSPKITAECGKQVTLNCEVSSSPNGLSIKQMAWIQNQTSLCSVDKEGKIKPHSRSDFHCEYKHGQLSLIFKRVRPLESGNSKPYTCKLQSNRGASDAKTIVEVQGQCQQCVYIQCDSPSWVVCILVD